MSHDKIKAATRERMTKTGEPYTLARRAVVREHKQAQRTEDASGAMRNRAFEVVARQLVKQGQEVRSRLTSALGTDEIQRRFAALHAFRNQGHSVDDPSAEVTDTGRPTARTSVPSVFRETPKDNEKCPSLTISQLRGQASSHEHKS